MILPLRLLWGLRMSLRRKLAVGGLFSIAILCTITSVIRLIQINQRTKNTVPNGLWIILWGSLEASTAIIVGSLTSFRFIRKSSGSSGGAYNTTGQSQWPSARKFHSIQMQSYGQESHGPVTTVCHGAETSSSRESLAPKHAVMVTRQHQVPNQGQTSV
ncbi:hypothetical protein PRK78_007422 [Emydomyces testavorans]|uniref:Rhodopsin domain-containing protein n=1 Tax=Emydomyces testavorans TaxID=2070801 RepID=A0AAF0DNN6_9EURO|nr:hypothetical protein PRK78_007422 [Emydomyces testavorans]